MKKVALISLFFVICNALLIAQDVDSVKSVEIVYYGQKTIDLKPKFRGTLRTRYEYNINENLNRFAVRNARAAVSGNANHWITYLMQVDLSDNGNFRVLDAEITMKPTENLEIIIGQTFVPFTQKHLLTPGRVMFTNMAFVNQYMSGAPRDIGVVANYRFLYDEIVPINLTGAVFNGTSINNPRWTKPSDLGYAFRLMLGSMNNFQLALKTYQATDTEGVKNEVYGADMRLLRLDGRNGSFFTFEAEIVRGNYILFGYTTRQFGYNLQAGNMLRIGNEGSSIRYIEPIARWDVMGSINRNTSNANRLTLGTNFGFHPTYRKTELRLNYEKFFVDKNMADVYFGANSTAWHDRIVIEFILNF
jgi:hypothetical protein